MVWLRALASLFDWECDLTIPLLGGLAQVEGDCAPGCSEDVTQPACPQGHFLLDESTCVTIEQCTCRLPNGNVLQVCP